MAREGFVYLLKYKSKYSVYYKIGCSKNVHKRVDQLSSCIYPDLEYISIEHKIKALDKFEAETFLQNMFKKVRRKREFFDLTQEDVEWIKSLNEEDLYDLIYGI